MFFISNSLLNGIFDGVIAYLVKKIFVTFTHVLRFSNKDRKPKMSEEALLSVFTRLRRSLFRLAKGIVSDDDEASDVLQDAFCRLWPRKDGINTSGEAKALAQKTVVNLSLDVLRKKKRIVCELREGCNEKVAESVHDQIEREELYRWVESLIERRLTPLQRKIFRLKEFECQSVAEIARSHKMQESAVRMNLSRARKTIRELYIQLEHER